MNLHSLHVFLQFRLTFLPLLHLLFLFIHIELDQMFAQDLVSGGVVDVGVPIVVIVVELTVVVWIESLG